MILLCYDGSTDARAAIEQAGKLFGGQSATILTVWEPFIDVVARAPAGFGLVPGMVDYRLIDEASSESAAQTAEKGAELAREAGLTAQARTSALVTSVADAVISQAQEIDASAIVMGTRGLTGMKSLLVGSVSHAVIQHTDRTVVVVPSAEIAAARKRGRLTA